VEFHNFLERGLPRWGPPETALLLPDSNPSPDEFQLDVNDLRFVGIQSNFIRTLQKKKGRTFVRPFSLAVSTSRGKTQKISFKPSWIARGPPEPSTGLELVTSGVWGRKPKLPPAAAAVGSV